MKLSKLKFCISLVLFLVLGCGAEHSVSSQSTLFSSVQDQNSDEIVQDIPEGFFTVNALASSFYFADGDAALASFKQDEASKAKSMQLLFPDIQTSAEERQTDFAEIYRKRRQSYNASDYAGSMQYTYKGRVIHQYPVYLSLIHISEPTRPY